MADVDATTITFATGSREQRAESARAGRFCCGNCRWSVRLVRARGCVDPALSGERDGVTLSALLETADDDWCRRHTPDAPFDSLGGVLRYRAPREARERAREAEQWRVLEVFHRLFAPLLRPLGEVRMKRG